MQSINHYKSTAKGHVFCVSLGPGDPELVTLKALQALQQSNVIYCPGTIKNQQFNSKALNILQNLPLTHEHIHCFTVNMSKDRTLANQVYDDICIEIMQRINQGEIISITAEGDSGFYSSGNYLLKKLKDSGIQIKVIAGIPAFIAAGALSGLHIVKQDEKLIVLPGNTTCQELQFLADNNYVIVIMKLSQCIQVIHELIHNNPDYHYHYYEHIGTPQEYYTTEKEKIFARDFPYFSLMIIKK